MSTLMGVSGVLGGGFAMLVGFGTGSVPVFAIGAAFALLGLAASSVIAHLAHLTVLQREVLEELRAARQRA